mgnify:CR=1 FL=1
MKPMKTILAAAVLACVAGTASAQVLILMAASGAAGATAATTDTSKPADTGVYAEAGVMGMRFSKDDGSDAPKLARFILGYDMRKNLSIEGLASFSLKSDDQVSGRTMGFYMKPKKQFSNGAEVFARIGLASTEREYKDQRDSSTKLSYGLGFAMPLTKDVYGQIDYMHYGRVDGYTAAGLTASVGVRF